MNNETAKKHLVVKSTGELVLTLDPSLVEDKVVELDLSNIPGNHKIVMVQYLSEEKFVSGELYDEPYIRLVGSNETLEGLVKWLIDPYWDEADQLIPLVYPPSLDELHTFEDWLGFFSKPQHDYIDEVAIIENPGKLLKQMRKEGINEIVIPSQKIKGEKEMKKSND